MRVLLVVHALPPDTHGGTELYTARLAERLARDHEVAVATPAGADADLDGVAVVELPGGVDDDVDPGSVGRGPAAGVVRPAVDDAFVDLLDRAAPDVVHLQHLKGLSANLPLACRARQVACLLTLHDFWTVCHREQLYRPDGARCAGPESVAKCAECYRAWRERETGGVDHEEGFDLDGSVAEGVDRRGRLLREALSATDRLVSPSRFLARRFVAFGADPDGVVQLRNGIEADRFDETGFDPDGPVRFGYAGRVAETKGVHLLVAAFARLDADAELHVHGKFDPETDPYHAHLADAAATDDRITFHGFYPDAADPYGTMDALVLPSLWYENSPIVVQEAFASGVPVVAADVGGMAELVDDGVDGVHFEAGDADDLARTLGELARDPGRIDALREGVAEPTRLDDHARDLGALYAAEAGGA